MPADARISTALSAHPKTKKLKKRTGAAGCWSFVCLLLWAADNRHDGNLTGLTDEEIELAAEWEGDDGALVRALVDVRFLDGSPKDYRVHDWAEHQPWASGRGQRIEAARKAADKRWHPDRDAECMHSASGAHGGQMRMGTAPNPTQGPTQDPNQEVGSSVTAPTSETSVTTLPCVGNGHKLFDVTSKQVGEGEGKNSNPPPTRAAHDIRDGLAPTKYAAMLLTTIGLSDSSQNVRTVATAITSYAKSTGMSHADSAKWIQTAAMEDHHLGIEINTFWFNDGRYGINRGKSGRKPTRSAAEERVSEIVRTTARACGVGVGGVSDDHPEDAGVRGRIVEAGTGKLPTR